MRNRVLAVLALLAAWGVTVLAQEDEPVRSEAVSGEETLAQGDQVDLVKITKERIPMDKRLLSLCIGPQAAVGPHSAAEVDVFVNSTVIDYRSKTRDSFSYPVGAKFVKKKYPKIGAKTPDMATRERKCAELRLLVVKQYDCQLSQITSSMTRGCWSSPQPFARTIALRSGHSSHVP